MGSSHIDFESLPTRKTLVGKLKDLEDNQSWRIFFETYWKLIYAFAIKSGCTDTEAEEVVQETVISVARKMPDFQYNPAVCCFKGWLLHVANWRVIDQLRRRRHDRVEPTPRDESQTGLLESIPDPLTPRSGTPLGWRMETERHGCGDRTCQTPV